MDTTTIETSSISPPLTKKSVSFNDSSCHVTLIPIPTLKDCVNAWYQRADYEFFKAHTMRLIKTINSDRSKKPAAGTISKEELSCVIGLEVVMHGERAKVRRSRRDRIRTIVLMQSYFQRSSESIAQDCWTVSEESAKDAECAAKMVADQVIRDTMKWLLASTNKKAVSSSSTSKTTRRTTTFFNSKNKSCSSSLLKEKSNQTRQRWIMSTALA